MRLAPDLAVGLLIITSALLVYEFAAFSVLTSANVWLKALPTLVPFGALVAAVIFSKDKSTWVSAVFAWLIGTLRQRPILLYAVTIGVTTLSLLFGRHVLKLVQAKDGIIVIQVVRKTDVPSQRLPGIPVIMDHQLREETIERSTDNSGRAIFEVDFDDVYALRIRRTADVNAPVVILASNLRLGSDKQLFKLVSLDDIPPETWIEDEDTVNVLNADASFRPAVALPQSFFLLRDTAAKPHVVTVGSNVGAFPFTLPRAETIIRRQAFTIGFSPTLKLPRWAAYKLTRGIAIPRAPDVWRADPSIHAASQAAVSDYLGSGFDRGHLVRRTDMFGNPSDALNEINTFTAVVPQLPYVNRQTWQSIEDYATDMAREEADVYVIRGPIFDSQDNSPNTTAKFIGPNNIPVPTHFFQILYVERNGRTNVDAHIVPNSYVQFDDIVNRFRSDLRTIAAKTGLAFDTPFSR